MLVSRSIKDVPSTAQLSTRPVIETCQSCSTMNQSLSFHLSEQEQALTASHTLRDMRHGLNKPEQYPHWSYASWTNGSIEDRGTVLPAYNSWSTSSIWNEAQDPAGSVYCKPFGTANRNGHSRHMSLNVVSESTNSAPDRTFLETTSSTTCVEDVESPNLGSRQTPLGVTPFAPVNLSTLDRESSTESHNQLEGPAKKESYAVLIYRALMEAEDHCLELRDIYKWVETHTDRVEVSSPSGWKNSIRHNLSMNRV